MLTLPAEVEAANTELIALIDTLVERHGSERSALIPILQELRSTRRDIDDVAMQVVADRLGITPVAVQGVATFYAFLGVGRTGRHVLRLCRTLSCEMAGVREVADELSRLLGIDFGGTTEDGEFTLEWANCIGMCDQAPALLCDTAAHGHMTRDKAWEVLTELRAMRDA